MMLQFKGFYFSGVNPNPKWDQNDPANVQFAATLFGFHLFMNLSFSVILCVMVKVFGYRAFSPTNRRNDVKFRPLPVSAVDDEQETLIEDSL